VPTKPKLIQAGTVRERRIIYLSFVADEKFSNPVRERLTGKLKGQLGIQLMERGPGLAGAEAEVVTPWGEIVPTDVVVLYSDEYRPHCVGADPIADNAFRPELNFVLKERSKARYRVWFGLVQNTPWENVSIEGTTLEAFANAFHELRPAHQVFREERDNPYALDDAAADAARRLTKHDIRRCTFCGEAEPDSPAASPAVPAQKGFFARLFSRGEN
jgi:hypothetical protein